MKKYLMILAALMCIGCGGNSDSDMGWPHELSFFPAFEEDFNNATLRYMYAWLTDDEVDSYCRELPGFEKEQYGYWYVNGNARCMPIGGPSADNHSVQLEFTGNSLLSLRTELFNIFPKPDPSKIFATYLSITLDNDEPNMQRVFAYRNELDLQKGQLSMIGTYSAYETLNGAEILHYWSVLDFKDYVLVSWSTGYEIYYSPGD